MLGLRVSLAMPKRTLSIATVRLRWSPVSGVNTRMIALATDISCPLNVGTKFVLCGELVMRAASNGVAGKSSRRAVGQRRDRGALSYPRG
jgi:hypothetical protein